MSQHDASFDKLDTASLSDDAIKAELSQHALTLNADEARRVQELLGRPPTITELTLFDTMWSEHCSYKSSKPTLKEFLPTTGSNVIVGPGSAEIVVDFGQVLTSAGLDGAGVDGVEGRRVSNPKGVPRWVR